MSDYLDEEEQLARLKSWWDENGMAVLGAVIVAVVGIVGWNWYSGQSDAQRQAQTQLLKAYDESEEAQREKIVQELGEQFSGSAAHSLVLFDQAKIAVAAGDLALAQQHLEAVVNGADDDLIVDLARIRLAKVLMALDLSDDALNTLAAVRNEGYRALALEVQGDIHAANGAVEQAHLAYQAARDSLREGDNRPILEMKLENAKPFEGQYVEMTDQLSEALREAASALNVQVPEPADVVLEPAEALENPAEVEAAPEESSP